MKKGLLLSFLLEQFHTNYKSLKKSERRQKIAKSFYFERSEETETEGIYFEESETDGIYFEESETEGIYFEDSETEGIYNFYKLQWWTKSTVLPFVDRKA